ncbi:hypothetical protein NUSPORA_00377 [Nucleospora cyclopteri]
MLTKQIKEHSFKKDTRVKSVDFHPFSPLLLAGNHCGTLYVHNIMYNTEIALHEHSGSIRTVKFHPSGNIFATGGDDKVVNIWDSNSLKVMQRLKGHTDYVRSVDFHPTQPWIVTGSDDCTIKVFNYYTGELLTSSVGHHHYVMAVLFLDSTHIVSASLDHTIGMWNCEKLFEKKTRILTPSLIMYQTVDAHDRGVNCLYTKDGKVFSGSDDKEIKVWSFHSEMLEYRKSIRGHDSNVTGMVEIDGTLLSVGEDSKISVDQERKKYSIKTEGRLWCIASKDDWIAVGSDIGLILYNCRKKVQIGRNVFSVDNEIFKFKGESKEKIAFLSFSGEKIVSLQLVGNNEIFVNYKKHDSSFSHGVVKNGGIFEEDGGQLLYAKNKLISLKNNILYADAEKIEERIEREAELKEEDGVVYLLTGNEVAVIYGDDIKNYQLRTFTFKFPVLKIIPNDSSLVFMGMNNVVALNENKHNLWSINELSQIVDGALIDVNGEKVFIYVTVRQVKFYYEGEGVLSTIGEWSKLLHASYSARDSKINLIFINYNGEVNKEAINAGEILFRIAVKKDEDILGTIKEQQLPGLSPLEYLIKKNRGSIALPYIKDRERKVELYLSENRFKECFDLLFDETSDGINFNLIKSLANKIVSTNSTDFYQIAESCYKKIEDFTSLFYFYLFTRQESKIKEIQLEEYESVYKILMNKEESEIVELMKGNLKIRGDNNKEGDIKKEDININNREEDKEEDMNNNREENDVNNNKEEDMNINKEIKEEDMNINKEIKEENMNINREEDVYNNKEENMNNNINKEIKEKNDVNINKEEGINNNINNINIINNKEEEDKSMEVKNTNYTDLSDENDSSKTGKEIHSCDSKSNLENDESVSNVATINDSESSSILFNRKELSIQIRKSDLFINSDPENGSDSCYDALTTVATDNSSNSNEIDKITAYKNDALELTTKGKFQVAVDTFRECIFIIARNLNEEETFVELRKRIGKYLRGMRVEIARKNITEYEVVFTGGNNSLSFINNILVLYFYNSLKNEEIHSNLVTKLAMNVFYKNNQINCAKEMARILIDKKSPSKNVEKVLSAESKSREVLSDFEYEVILKGNKIFIGNSYEYSKECLFCYSKNVIEDDESDLCNVCLIGVFNNK